MDNTLIWMVKSSMIKPTRKNLEELRKKEDLFDFATIDKNAKEYKYALHNMEKAAQLGYSILTFADVNYPQCLRSLSFPPAVLYIRGNVAALNDIVYAGMVGSRESDDYGVRMALYIASEVGYMGAGVISGGATGVDAASHEGALRAKVPTIAVLGCGLDVDYPQSNRNLFERIEQSGGAIISEFPFGTPPLGKNFPRRNRIIAAMSSAVVLVRAAANSGGLITANQAIDMGKTVFSVPGSIDEPLSAGVNALIRDGAVPLLNPMDLIDELIALNPDYFVKEREKLPYIKLVPECAEKEEKKSNITLSAYEAEVVSLIEKGFNKQILIEENISFDASRITALLGMMEIKGIIKRKADKSYIIGGKC